MSSAVAKTLITRAENICSFIIQKVRYYIDKHLNYQLLLSSCIPEITQFSFAVKVIKAVVTNYFVHLKKQQCLTMTMTDAENCL